MEDFARSRIIGIDPDKVDIDYVWAPDPPISGGTVTMTAEYTVDLWLTAFMNINDIKMTRSSTMTLNF
jgi:hypothetical protein